MGIVNFTMSHCAKPDICHWRKKMRGWRIYPGNFDQWRGGLCNHLPVPWRMLLEVVLLEFWSFAQKLARIAQIKFKKYIQIFQFFMEHIPLTVGTTSRRKK